MCSLKYYFTLPFEECKKRRSSHWYESPDPPLNFEKIVWPQYLKHKNELSADEDIRYMDCQKLDMAAVLAAISSDLSKFAPKSNFWIFLPKFGPYRFSEFFYRNSLPHRIFEILYQNLLPHRISEFLSQKFASPSNFRIFYPKSYHYSIRLESRISYYNNHLFLW